MVDPSRQTASMTKVAVRTDKAPTPTGPFNQAIRVGDFVFTSGQAGRNRETGEMGDIRDQARRCIANIAAVLEAAGSSLAHVAKVTVFLRNASDWKSFNEEYVKLMPEPLPARSSAIVELKGPDMLVEMEVIAVIPPGDRPEGHSKEFPMTNPMSIIDTLRSRATPKDFSAPAPAADVLKAALEAAVAAPDHGRMRPWRFILIEGAARVSFGAVLASSLRRRKPDANAGELEREAAKALRSPLIIVVAAKLTPRPGVPEIEQILATGAAVQNLMLALHAQGFGAAWKTGEAAYDPMVKTALGLDPGDAIVAFLYAGTPGAIAARPRPPAEDYVRHWTADGQHESPSDNAA
jgi:reactive intermediate/imine deaminase